MKDSLLNLLVFLLVFLVVAGLFLAFYGISLTLVPGGKGLVFANPFAGALIPAVLGGLAAAQFRSVRKPGNFAMTWILQAVTFFLLLSLAIPVIKKMPPVRASDESPLVPGRFLPLDDNSLILSAPHPGANRSASPTVLIPADGSPMFVSADTQYDPLNQRFVFSQGDPKSVGGTGPERRYYEYPPAVVWVETDFLAVYLALYDSASRDQILFWSETGSVTFLFLGLYFFYSWRTWPLIQAVFVLVMARLAISFLVYAFWSLPNLLEIWAPGMTWLKTWAPLLLIDIAAATLFFMTVLTKPHRRAALL